MKKIVFAAVLVIAGCSKKSEEAGGAPAGTSCAEAAEKAVGALPAGSNGGEVQTKLRGILTTRCTEDKWPAATVECYATQVKDMSGMRKCRETLPKEQQDKMMTEIRAAMMGAAGAGGGPMHGAPPPAP
jgi:hypothetical protein